MANIAWILAAVLLQGQVGRVNYTFGFMTCILAAVLPQGQVGRVNYKFGFGEVAFHCTSFFYLELFFQCIFGSLTALRLNQFGGNECWTPGECTFRTYEFIFATDLAWCK